MGKKNSESNVTELRANADAAVEVWRSKQVELNEAAKRKAEAESGDILRRIAAAIAFYVAEQVLSRAAVEADEALIAAERAEGDEHALAANIPRVREELTAYREEEFRLVAALSDVRARQGALIVAAERSTNVLRQQRAAAGLPAPPSWPAAVRQIGAPVDVVRDQLLALDKRFEEGPPVKDNSARISKLRNEERELRANIERARLEADEERAEEALLEAAHERKRQADNARARQEYEARAAKYRATQEETDRLANAHRAREAAEGSAA